jgi:fructokinase
MTKTILALGEVLWDLFPDGPRFGGAPANFACACAELGRRHVWAFLGSVVGTDKLGDEARQRLKGHGVDLSHVAATAHLTGQVLINLDSHGKASYRFLEDTAWDHLTATPALLATAETADVVHFGTLGQRAAESRDAIREMVRAVPPGGLRVLDINLRAPHWSADVLLDSLALANVVKLNDEELPLVAGVLGVTGDETEVLAHLLSRFHLKLVALTRGANGSLLLAADGTRDERPAEAVGVIDTVGAGDAFTAALALGLAFGHPLDRTHLWAAETAAFVCTQPGATPTFPPRYHLMP